jgi:hypothetical protein
MARPRVTEGKMPELRLNLVTREWVIVEKATGVNPVDFIEICSYIQKQRYQFRNLL